MEIKRFLQLPNKSFILLGPRGTGKSSLIKKVLKSDLEIDLLQSKNFLQLSANPSDLQKLTEKLKPGSWVFIDEIQKIPSLLDEVHYLYEEKGLNFALSGSSARKLRRQGANLLAGRALSHSLFAMTYYEYQKKWSLDDAIQWGALPKSIVDSKNKRDYLSSYVETYLREELIEEGILRKLEPFARFLKVSGIYNAQILNVENVARESHLSRSTVQSYFDILEETLIGFRLPPFQAKIVKKEIKHPKFYLFDNGVARACSNMLYDDVDSVWLGHSFEGLIINEIHVYNRYLKKNKDLFYFNYSGGYEIDCVIETKRKTLSTKQELIALEIKLATRWDKRWNDSLLDFKERSGGRVKKLFGIYRGREIINQGDIEILPAENFLNRLALGKIF